MEVPTREYNRLANEERQSKVKELASGEEGGAAQVAVIGGGLLVACSVLNMIFGLELLYTTAVGSLGFAILHAWKKYRRTQGDIPDRMEAAAYILIMTFASFYMATRGTGATVDAGITALSSGTVEAYEGPHLSGFSPALLGNRVTPDYPFNPPARWDDKRRVWMVQVVPLPGEEGPVWREAVRKKKKPRIKTRY